VTAPLRLGIIGTGALGGAIARRILARDPATSETLMLASRSGARAGFEQWPGLHMGDDPQALVDECEILLLALPPAQLGNLRLNAPGLPVVSVIAGATVAQLQHCTGSPRILRAMCSPAAERGLAFSPIFAASEATANDRALARSVFSACGLVDFVDAEHHIDHFTALTGPVPGFVAFFARAMVEHAVGAGIDPDMANRAIRQLFLASGHALAEGSASPAEHVAAMVDYAGTTAAGLEHLEHSSLSQIIHTALDAAVSKTRSIAARTGVHQE
jgi:pyrroline-5-carboxylate reductase